jgi:pimeloyl-CoA synthetase
MNNTTNIAIVTLRILVNTDNMDETVKQLTERAKTHETTVDVNATVEEADPSIIKNVEEGNYQLGQANLF